MQQFIKVLVVDDEPYSREELKYMLQEFPFIEVVGEAGSGEDAVMKAIQLQPDVVFLDVEMPKQNGMQTAQVLKELKCVPLVVFATAYPDFAVEAFRHDAVGYILKPFKEEEIEETVKRLEKRLAIYKKDDSPKREGKIAIDFDREIFYLDPLEIIYVVREDKITKVITENEEIITKIPLKEFEARLESYQFFRIHKSFLVNLTYVTKLTPWFNGAYELQLDGVKELLPVSRNYAKTLRARMEL